jgi:hypothetical protein
MAEVTGELGGQPILLENAATEATLYALLQATLATNSNKSQAAKIQQAYEEALKRTTKSQQLNLEQNNKNRKSIADEIERRDQLNKRIEEEKEKRKKFMDGLRDVVGVLDSIGNVIGKTLSFALSTATPKVTDFTDALSGIPIIGPIIGAVGKAMQEQIDIFRELSSVGADFGSGMHTMRTMAARAGLPLGVFAKAITENSSALAQLGGSTTAGARIFTAVNRSLQGPFQQGLARLGFSMEETAELTAGYLAIQTKLGRAQSMNQTEINAGTKEHLLQLDLLARVHGMSRKEAQKLLDQQAQDKRFKLFYAQMGDNKELQGFFAGLTNANKDFSDGMADLMMNNGVPSANNDTARSIALNSPRLVKLSMQLRNNSISQDEANRVIREEAVRMGELAKTTGKTQAGFANLGSPVFDVVAAMLGLKKIGAELTAEEKKQLKAKEDSTKNQANFDKALMSLRESMYKALLPLIGYVERNIVSITKALEKFVREFVKIMEGPGGLKGALLHGVREIGKILGPALKEMFSSMLTNPWVIGGLVAGFALLFGSAIVQAALARKIIDAINSGPGGFDLPDGPDRNKPGGKSGKGGFRIPAGTKDLAKNVGRGLTSTAAVGFTLLTMDGNVGQNYPFPQDGPYKGMEINPATGKPWDKLDLAEYKKDPEAYAKKPPKYGTSSTPPTASMPEYSEQVADAITPEAIKMRAASIVQIKELTQALDKLDYNKLIIPDIANKNIEISTGKMRLLRGEVNALTTSFKNLNDTGLGKITKGINALSGEFKIFNEGFSIFKKRFEELDRTTERAALEDIGEQLSKLNTNAVIIADNTGNTATNTGKLKGKPGIG